MALINCPECGKEISDKATQCIGCGCPILSANNFHENTEKPQALTNAFINQKEILATNVVTAKQTYKLGVKLIIALIMSLWAFVTPVFTLGKEQRYIGVNGYTVFSDSPYYNWSTALLIVFVIALLLTAIITIIIVFYCLFSKQVNEKTNKAVLPCFIIQYVLITAYFIFGIASIFELETSTLAYIPWIIGSLIFISYFLIPRLRVRTDTLETTENTNGNNKNLVKRFVTIHKKPTIIAVTSLAVMLFLVVALPIAFNVGDSCYNGSSYTSSNNGSSNSGTSSKFNFKTNYGNLSYNSWCDIASDGSWMRIDTNPNDIEDYYNSTALSKIKDINKDLGFTDALYQKMITTRALDGRVSDENSKAKVSWTYHPDYGLNVLYEQK